MSAIPPVALALYAPITLIEGFTLSTFTLTRHLSAAFESAVHILFELAIESATLLFPALSFT